VKQLKHKREQRALKPKRPRVVRSEEEKALKRLEDTLWVEDREGYVCITRFTYSTGQRRRR